VLGFASCHPRRLFSYGPDSSRCIMCLLDQSPNQALQLTADRSVATLDFMREFSMHKPLGFVRGS
jgi:hypothetical protein